jgi:hypothetical protein
MDREQVTDLQRTIPVLGCQVERSDRAACSSRKPHVAAMATIAAWIESVSHDSRNRRSRLRRRFAPLLVLISTELADTERRLRSKNRAEELI